MTYIMSGKEYIMTLLSPRNQLIASLCLAGAGLVLFFGNSYRSWEMPLDWMGTVVFVAAVWFFVDALHRIPHSQAELAIAPQEWQAWVGLAFCSACLVAIWIYLPAFAAPVSIRENPEAGAAGRSIGMLFVAWAVLAYVLNQRWAGTVISDERDRDIEKRASTWGRAATAGAVICIAVLLGFSPTDRLQTLSYPWLAQMLMSTLLVGVWVDNAGAALLYWRDRRQVDLH